jgi:hypothetical protein
MTHLEKLDALISAAQNARGEAEAGILFASFAGKRLVNCAHDLFECDQLYRLGEDVEHEMMTDSERKAA